jgi:hypothetical protein
MDNQLEQKEQIPAIDIGLVNEAAAFSSNLQPVVDLLTSLIPLALAILGGYIGVRQYITSRQKLKLELFGKRFAIFQATKTYMGQVLTGDFTEKQAQREFLIATQGARFVFDKKIRAYIDSIWEKSIDLENWSKDQDSSENSASRAAYMKWFNDQLSAIEEKFAPYMQLPQ